MAASAQDSGRSLPLEARPAPEAPEGVDGQESAEQPPTDPQDTEAAARWARLQAEAEAERERRRIERERYEQGLRDAEAARQAYEADTARHRAELERARAAEEEYRRQRAAYEAETGNVGSATRGSGPAPAAATAEEAPVAAPVEETRAERRARERAERAREREARRANETCDDRNRRNRRRGQIIGGIVGGLAVALADREGRAEVALLAVPAGVLLGDAIAGLLDCREQEQAALATERALEGGVGSTVEWASETRPNVTGSSTVLAMAPDPNGGECMTVTDIVIIDGEETRAPKTMCRRPPSNRFVRV
ncbi:MAG: hypothetical protein ACT4N8_08575 [Sphingosinicella sp.]